MNMQQLLEKHNVKLYGEGNKTFIIKNGIKSERSISKHKNTVSVNEVKHIIYGMEKVAC